MSKLLFSKDSNQAKQLSRLYRQKKIRRIYHGIYTDNFKTSIAEIVKSNWMNIVSHIVSKGILSFRTAMELRPIPFKNKSIVFITSSYTKTITLQGLVIKILKGNNHNYIEQVLPNIARSNRARMLLENLTIVRGTDYKDIKTIGIEGVEIFLSKDMRLGNEKSLNKIRDEAKEMAEGLGLTTEYEKLDQIISALLSTHPKTDILTTKYAKSVAKKESYDSSRIKLFEDLTIYLKKCKFKKRKYIYSKASFKNLTFFESYFSNYIEGTEFIIDEAEDIVFKGIEISNRHADSHDVLSNFTLSNDYSEMNITPANPKELLDILQNRHAYLMKERENKRPGKFKEKPNKAGNTYFVAPADVIGTLSHGYELYELLNDGLEKALFMHFMVSEVHPFDDGNGRLSRIMMNAELVKSSLFKIIIPSVHMDNYLNGIRVISRDNYFRTYCKVMDQAQAYIASINWLDYGESREHYKLIIANYRTFRIKILKFANCYCNDKCQHSQFGGK